MKLVGILLAMTLLSGCSVLEVKKLCSPVAPKEGLGEDLWVCRHLRPWE